MDQVDELEHVHGLDSLQVTNKSIIFTLLKLYIQPRYQQNKI
jgi:hypothetical protein